MATFTPKSSASDSLSSHSLPPFFPLSFPHFPPATPPTSAFLPSLSLNSHLSLLVSSTSSFLLSSSPILIYLHLMSLFVSAIYPVISSLLAKLTSCILPFFLQRPIFFAVSHSFLVHHPSVFFSCFSFILFCLSFVLLSSTLTCIILHQPLLPFTLSLLPYLFASFPSLPIFLSSQYPFLPSFLLFYASLFTPSPSSPSFLFPVPLSSSTFQFLSFLPSFLCVHPFSFSSFLHESLSTPSPSSFLHIRVPPSFCLRHVLLPSVSHISHAPSSIPSLPLGSQGSY